MPRHGVIDQGGDYALRLKGNQGSLHDDVSATGGFLDDPATPVAQATQVNKGHGRIETRVAVVSDDIAWLQQWHDWPGLQAVGKVTAIRRMVGQDPADASEETRYYPVSSTGQALLSQAFPPERCTRIFDQSHRARPLGN